MMASDRDDNALGGFDHTPLQPVRPGSWVESDADMFERERAVMEAEIEAARERAASARQRIAAQRASQGQSARTTQADLQQSLAAVDAEHRLEVQRLERYTAQQVESTLDQARRAADETVRAAMAGEP